MNLSHTHSLFSLPVPCSSVGVAVCFYFPIQMHFCLETRKIPKHFLLSYSSLMSTFVVHCEFAHGKIIAQLILILFSFHLNNFHIGHVKQNYHMQGFVCALAKGNSPSFIWCQLLFKENFQSWALYSTLVFTFEDKGQGDAWVVTTLKGTGMSRFERERERSVS